MFFPSVSKNAQGTRTTHHLIFATKNFKGYEIMKEIMAHESSEQEQGVPSFEYSPASKNFPLLFALSRPLDDLEESLLSGFCRAEHWLWKPYTWGTVWANRMLGLITRRRSRTLKLLGRLRRLHLLIRGRKGMDWLHSLIV